MSAFIVEDETINRIVSFFYGNHDHNHKYHYCLTPLIDTGYKLDNQLGCKRLAEEMFTLNCDSIEQRYGVGEAKEFRSLDFNYQFTGSGIDRYQLLKSLRCFLYQCSEGDIPEQANLYRALDEVVSRICRHIVTNSPQYDKAKWD